MEAKKLLEFYYNTILFKPDYPETEKNDYLVNDERRYVPYESIFGGESEAGYNIFIGKAETEVLEKAIDESYSAGTQSFTYIAMIKTDKRGYYIRQSFYISPVVFALAKIIKEKNPYTSLDLNLINKANDEFDEFLIRFDRKLEYRELREVFNYVINKLNLGEIDLEFEALIKDRDLISTNPMDGYLKDLEAILISGKTTENMDLVIRNMGRVMKNASPFKDDLTLEKLKTYTSPEKNSLGMWPGHEKLSLRQQLILNTMISDHKTGLEFFRQIRDPDEANALILEYMTSNVVERAIVMSKYGNPDEAFTEVRFKHNTEYSTSYYKADDKLTLYNLILTGYGDKNANELKRLITPVLSGRENPVYYEVNGNPAIVASFTSNREVWKNIQDGYKAKEIGMKAQINDVFVDYEKTRVSFRTALDKVIKKRELILNEYRLTYSYGDLLEKVTAAGNRKEELENRLESTEASKDFKEAELTQKKAELDAHLAEMKELSSKLGFFKKYLTFFFKKDPDVIRHQAMEAAREVLQEDMEESNRDLNKILNEYHNIKDELDIQTEDYTLRKAASENALEKITAYRGHYGKSFTDDEILHQILAHSFNTSPEIWTDEEYNDLRADLFLESLKMHRAFINNSRFLKADLNLFNLALEGKIHEGDTETAFKVLFEASALVYPLTFVAFEYAPYLLSTTGANSMGSLIIRDSRLMPLAQSMAWLWRFKNIMAFNYGTDHWTFPDIPEIIAVNVVRHITGERSPEALDLSLADVLNVI